MAKEPWNAVQEGKARQGAREIIVKLNIRHPSEINIEAIAFYHKIWVKECKLDKTDGYLIRKGEKVCIFVNQGIELTRKRFTIAHELGHFMLHSKESQLNFCLIENFKYFYEYLSPNEKEANIFVGELLMPQGLFTAAIGKSTPSIQKVQELAKEFQTSLTATAIRYMELCSFTCAVVFSKDGKIKWFKPSEYFKPRITVGMKVPEDSNAAKLHAGETAVTRFNRLPIGSWISSKSLDRSDWIEEQAIPLPAYGSVMTLLWMKQSDEES